jgi:hypothetical protein
MSVSHLRPLTPTRFRRRASKRSVELLEQRIAGLASDRQTLRERGASDSSLERNRIKLARAQWELSHALIERHHHAA